PERVRGHPGVRRHLRREHLERAGREVLRCRDPAGWAAGVPAAALLPAGPGGDVRVDVRAVRLPGRGWTTDQAGAAQWRDQRGPGLLLRRGPGSTVRSGAKVRRAAAA